jgi:hypothetical protein
VICVGLYGGVAASRKVGAKIGAKDRPPHTHGVIREWGVKGGSKVETWGRVGRIGWRGAC